MPKKILIVDDSKVARIILRRMINEIDADWEIFEASNGTEAIERSQDLTLDAMVMDFNMPGINGLDAASEIRKSFPDIKITMLTANIQKANEIRAGKIGIGFLTKPVELEDFAKFLRE